MFSLRALILEIKALNRRYVFAYSVRALKLKPKNDEYPMLNKKYPDTILGKWLLNIQYWKLELKEYKLQEAKEPI